MYSLNYRQPKIDYSSVYNSLGKGIFDDEEEDKRGQSNSSSIIGSLGQFGNIASGLFGNSTNNTPSSLFGSFGDSDELYGAPSESSQRWMDFGSNIFDLGKNYLGSGSSGSSSKGFFGKLGGSSGGAKAGGGGTPWALIGQVAKSGYNATTGHDDEDYSDVEESVIYPLQGAAIGNSIMPGWGALAGALYGWSYGLKDDTNKWVGIKEGSFWDKLRHPIGMGDGGGFIDLG